MIRALCLATMLVFVAASCGDDAGPDATPEQAEAIGNLIDAELSETEQRCILEELIATGIEPRAILDGTVTGDEDAELLAIAVTCVDDLAGVPAFVQSVIEASTEAGTPLTEDEAICVIGRMADEDPVTAAADCVDAAADPETGAVAPDSYGDDPILDRLWDACEEGNNQACDELYLSAPLDTAYVEYARTCAGRLPDSVGFRCFLDLG